jgi:hypothetical protein
MAATFHESLIASMNRRTSSTFVHRISCMGNWRVIMVGRGTLQM